MNARRRRTNILLASITVIFFVARSPMVIFTFIYDFAKQLLPKKFAMHQFAYAITLLFGMLTPIANPILYSWLNENFRMAFHEKCCCFLKRKSQPATDEFVTVQGKVILKRTVF